MTCASGLLVALALLAGCGSGAAQQPATNATDTPVATTGSTGGGPVLPPAATATLAPVTGATDACGWFTLDAASQVLGSQAEAPSVQKTAGSTFCTYSAQANGETLLFVVQQGANVVNKYHSEQQTATGTSGYQVITGLGDGAFWTPTDGLVALNGQSFFTMQVLHVQSPSSLLPQEEQLIRVAFARLGSH
ncbi:MAG TPA: hypothetical protein VGR88_05380 [Ktedonobacterales bacterium]|nr:hypothetical protein [Ktedonobacterales bacterium]